MKSVLCLLLGLSGSVSVLGGGYGSSSDCNGIRGEMRMFYGRPSYIPKGWQLCDGTNYTPDMSGKFAIGAGGSYNLGASGGAAGFNVEIKNLPSHFHMISASDIDVSPNGPHTHPATGNVGGVPDHNHNKGSLETDDDGVHTHGFSTKVNEGGHDHNFDLSTSKDGDHAHDIDFQSGVNGAHAHDDTFAVEEEGSAHSHDIDVTVDGVYDHSHDLNVDDFKVCVEDHKHGIGSYALDDHVFTHGHSVCGQTDNDEFLHNHKINAVIGKSGSHDHEFDFETSKNGLHDHDDGTLVTDREPDHFHSIDEQCTSEDGKHDHDVSGYFEQTYETAEEDQGLGLHWDMVDMESTVGQDDYSPDETSLDGSHTHVVPAHLTNANGKHDHDVVGKTANNGLHSHDVLGEIYAVDDHCHSIDVSSDPNGEHIHKFKGNADAVEITLEHTISGYSAEDGAYTADISAVTGDTGLDGGHTHTAKAETQSRGEHDHELSGEVLSGGFHPHAVKGDTEVAGAHDHVVEGTIGQSYGYSSDSDNPDGVGADGAHSHDVSGTTGVSEPLHNHGVTGSTGDAGAHGHEASVSVSKKGKHTHTVEGKTESTGADPTVPVPVIPPYQSVYFICYVGVQSSSSSSESYSYIDGYKDSSDEDDGHDYDKYAGYDIGY